MGTRYNIVICKDVRPWNEHPPVILYRHSDDDIRDHMLGRYPERGSGYIWTDAG